MTVEPPLPPRAPDVAGDLPAADVETVVADRLLDESRLDGADLSGRTLYNLKLRGSRLCGVDLGDATLAGIDAADVVVGEGSWANAGIEQGVLVRVEVTAVRATGARFAETVISDATFADCRLDLTSFRHAELERVAFRDCRLEEADFHGATLRSVRFERCVIAGATVENAMFDRCELRGCDLTDVAGVERLAGTRIPLPDVIQIAGLLAAAAGIDVVD